MSASSSKSATFCQTNQRSVCPGSRVSRGGDRPGVPGEPRTSQAGPGAGSSASRSGTRCRRDCARDSARVLLATRGSPAGTEPLTASGLLMWADGRPPRDGPRVPRTPVKRTPCSPGPRGHLSCSMGDGHWVETERGACRPGHEWATDGGRTDGGARRKDGHREEQDRMEQDRRRRARWRQDSTDGGQTRGTQAGRRHGREKTENEQERAEDRTDGRKTDGRRTDETDAGRRTDGQVEGGWTVHGGGRRRDPRTEDRWTGTDGGPRARRAAAHLQEGAPAELGARDPPRPGPVDGVEDPLCHLQEERPSAEPGHGQAAAPIRRAPDAWAVHASASEPRGRQRGHPRSREPRWAPRLSRSCPQGGRAHGSPGRPPPPPWLATDVRTHGRR
uniref:Uncharacterized protein n=1 Tax=Mustela putorius furo TaxID=9669 RepID=M3Z6B2_MUSPF